MVGAAADRDLPLPNSEDPPRLRIARFAAGILARPEVHPDCLAAYEAATALLVELGHEVVDVEPPGRAGDGGRLRRVWASLPPAARAPAQRGAAAAADPLAA